jgi:O-antigen ligase
VLLLNALKPTDAINAIAAGTMLIALYSVWSLLWSTNAWLEGKFVGPFGHWTSIGLALLAGLPSVMLINGKPKALIWILRFTSTALIGWLIYLTSSRTSWLTFIAILIFVGLSFLWKNYRRIAISATVVTAALLLIVIANWSQSLALLGKNDTITGRTEIWTTIVQHLTDSPFVGIGWSRTFTPEQPFFVILQEGAGFPAFHSHNDLLHWSLTTGVFGLLSFLLIVALIASAAVVNAKSLSNTLIAIWLGASLLELLISGITEISSYLPTGIFFLSALGTVGVVTTQSSPLRLRISLKRP